MTARRSIVMPCLHDVMPRRSIVMPCLHDVTSRSSKMSSGRSVVTPRLRSWLLRVVKSCVGICRDGAALSITAPYLWILRTGYRSFAFDTHVTRGLSWMATGRPSPRTRGSALVEIADGVHRLPYLGNASRSQAFSPVTDRGRANRRANRRRGRGPRPMARHRTR
jgi:hypothetical protein